MKRIISYTLMGAGVVLLVLNVFMRGAVNIALPLVFLMLGAAFYLLVPFAAERWRWAPLLYLPGSLLAALGMIFFLNVITQDWNSWAYAWLLLLAGLGFGMLLANRDLGWRQEFTLAGWIALVAGMTLFVLFGAIAGGLFIQIMAPILLVLGGLLLLWLRPKAIFRTARPAANLGSVDQAGLVEPLSPREIEVLRLVDQGLSNPEIAAQLVIADSTVKTHINNIYAKLGVKTRVQALRQARDQGLFGS